MVKKKRRNKVVLCVTWGGGYIEEVAPVAVLLLNLVWYSEKFPACP